MMTDALPETIGRKIKTVEEICAADRTAAARQEGHHVPRHVRPRASRPHPPSALRQEQGRYPDREPHRRRAHHQGATSGRSCRRSCARSISRRSRWSTTSSSTAIRRRSRTSRSIQPDYFAKGYEYAEAGINPQDRRRRSRSLQAYGGEIIFTPGDIVYSSSHLIETEPPNIATREAAAADGGRGPRLRRPATDRGRAARACAVHVVGDTIVDSYTYTTMIGGMTKTPTMSVRFDNRMDFVGGAGDRRQAPARGRRRGHVLDRARRRRA